MNVARLNFSHGDHEMHGKTVAKIREAAKKRPEKSVAIMLDTKGPEIRTGFFREDVGKAIELKQGQDLKLVTDYSFKGDNTCIALTYNKLPVSVKPGNTILMADGSLSLKVKECGKDWVMTEVMNNCKLGERKNCNLPGVKVDLPVLQEKDKDDLINFGIPQGVDFVAASFVQSAEDEKVFLARKMMIARCNMLGKPVVTATQMLESMTSLPRPTRAEASDVANSVLDGTDCVMLSGETAAGAFPLNAVTIMRRICEEAEKVVEYESLYLRLRQNTMAKVQHVTGVESICSSAVKATIDANCPLIVALTETGHTARVIAKYRPRAAILAISASETTVRQLGCVRGVVPMNTASFEGTDSVIAKALARAKADGMVKAGDMVVAVHGQREECPGHSNLLKMVITP